MDVSLRLIAGGPPTCARLIIKPSTVDRTLIKEPRDCATESRLGGGLLFCCAIKFDTDSSDVLSAEYKADGGVQ